MAPKYKGKISKSNQPKVSVNTLTNIQTSSPETSGEQQVISGPLATHSGPQTSLPIVGQKELVSWSKSINLYH